MIYEHTFSISDEDCLPADGGYPHLAYGGDVVFACSDDGATIERYYGDSSCCKGLVHYDHPVDGPVCTASNDSHVQCVRGGG